MNIFPYSLIFFSFPLNICFAPRLIRSGGHTVGITSSSCYTGQYFYLPPCRRSFGAGLFIFHLFAVIITLSTIILLHIRRCGVQCRNSVASGVHFRFRLNETSIFPLVSLNCGSLRLIADLDSVSFSVSSSPSDFFQFQSKNLSKKKSKPESRGPFIPQSCGRTTCSYYHYFTFSTLPPWKFLGRQWISRSGLNISPSQVTTCALPILSAVRFRSH